MKRVRQSTRRRLANRFHATRMRTLIKRLYAAEDRESAEPLLRETKAYLDRMATKGIIHKNKAANTKSRLDHHVAGL